MLNPISSTPPSGSPSTVAVQRPPAARDSSSAGSGAAPHTDTVQLSRAAQAALAALKEATETPAQTAREAGAGDRQAQKLLAQQATAQAAEK